MKYLIFSMIILFVSCKMNPESNNSDKLPTEENEVNVDDIAEKLMALWATGDTLKTIEIFHYHCEYIDVANNQIFKGIQGVNRYVNHVHKWASDVSMNIRNINTSEKIGYVEWTFTGKQTNPIEGRVPVATNNEITLNGVTLIEVKDGKIYKASDYMDVLGFVIQLGSKVELPGGVTIGN